MNSLRTSFLLLALISLGLCGCSKEARRMRILEGANKDFAAEQFEKAEIGYLNALRLSHADVTSIRQLGIIYFTEGRLLEAYRYLQKAAEMEPENVDIQLKLGMSYLAFRKSKEARAQAIKVLAKRPGDEEALLLLAETAVMEKDIPQVQKQLEQLRQRDKDRAGYHLALGASYVWQQDLAKAEREFKSALALEPKSGNVQLAFANLYWSRNELDQAERAFRAAAETAPWRSPRRVKLSEFQIKNGKTAEAKKNLEEITTKAPNYFPAWSLLIQIAFAEKKFDDCAALVTKVLAKEPSNYDALIYSGRLKLAKGNLTEAIADFERMTKLYGQAPEVQYQLGRAYLQSGDVLKASRSLNLALTSDPNFAQAILLQAEIQIRQGDVASAVPKLLNLTKSQPQLFQAHRLLASAYLSQQKFDEALAVYRRMMSLFPKEPQPPLFLGVTLMITGKRSEARKAFEKSLEIAPNYLPAVEQLVDLDVSEKAFAAALARVQKEIQKNPTVAELWLFQAKIQLAQKNLNEAEVSLQKAVALNPELQIAYTLLAQLYVDSNRRQEALKKLTEVSAKTNDVSVLMQIGMIYDQLKNYSAARDSYEKILSVKPRFSGALNNLAYLYSEHFEQLDKAYVMAEKARQLLPYEAAPADTLGWILFKKGNYSRALGLIQECASKLPDNGESQFHLGMIYYMLGEEEPARLALEKALQSKEDFPDKAEIPSRLAILRISEKSNSATDLAALEKRIKDQPGDPVATSRLAAIYEREGEIGKAVKICENALKADPSNAKIMLQLSKLYTRQQDKPKALELAKQAHNAKPEDLYISQLLGRLAYETGDYKWALSLVQEAAQKSPNKPDLNFDLARCYYGIGQVAVAETAMRNAVQSGVSFEGVEEAKRFLAMVDLYNNPAKIKTAVASVTAILKSEPNYIPALMVFAVAFEQENNPQAAKKQYEIILATNPLFAPAYRDLTILNVKFHIDDPKNFELAAKARAAFPENPEIAKILGILVYQRKDYARAAQLLEESSRKKDQDAELFYYLGLANYNLKKRDQCRNALKRALALNLTGQFAEEAKRVLAEIH